jgi:hypothetical protein
MKQHLAMGALAAQLPAAAGIIEHHISTAALDGILSCSGGCRLPPWLLICTLRQPAFATGPPADAGSVCSTLPTSAGCIHMGNFPSAPATELTLDRAWYFREFCWVNTPIGM